MKNNTEATPLLLPFRNNNSKSSGQNSRKHVIVLIGCLGVVGVCTIFLLGSTGSDPGSERVRSVRSAKSDTGGLLGNVLQPALRAGSKAIGGWSHKEDNNLCSTDGCLESASRLLNSINFSVNPCDDFYEFACGKWVAENKIPPTESRWSQFNILREEVNNITQEILSSAKDLEDPKPVNQVKDFYKGCLDIETLNSLGVKPIRDQLQQANHGDWPILIGSKWSLKSFNWLLTIADLRRDFLDTAIISTYVDQNFKDSDHYSIYIDQPSLILPRDMLINEDGSYDSILKAYSDYIISSVQIFAESNANFNSENIENEAEELIQFERALAKITTKDELRTDVDRMFNPYTIPEFQAITDGYGDLTTNLGVPLNWYTFLKSVFKTSGVVVPPDAQVIVLEKNYFRDLFPLLEVTNPRTVSNYLQFRYVSGLSGETTQELRDAAFKFNQALTGATEPPTRQKSCADLANNGLGMAIGVKYIVAADFDEAAKAEVNSMVEDIRVSFKQLLNEASWMDDTTRAKAQIKADKMRSFMAYPDWLRNKTAVEVYYANLEIDQSNYFKSLLQVSQWNGDRALKKFGTLVDREEWLTYPGVVNAFYAPSYNSITFLAGILQTPFYKRGSPAFLNYGSIGVVIGHEITHGFDNSGRQYDAAGNASPWWTSETLAKYTNKTKCISDQYSSYKPPEVDLKVNGQLTLGENIADNGGLRESLLAYRRYVTNNGPEKRLPGLEEYDPEQLFFVGFATMWCERITSQGLTNQILTDPHSPGRYRVIGPLSNNADFAKKWNCPVKSVMNPGADKRCTVW